MDSVNKICLLCYIASWTLRQSLHADPVNLLETSRVGLRPIEGEWSDAEQRGWTSSPNEQ